MSYRFNWFTLVLWEQTCGITLFRLKRERKSKNKHQQKSVLRVIVIISLRSMCVQMRDDCERLFKLFGRAHARATKRNEIVHRSHLTKAVIVCCLYVLYFLFRLHIAVAICYRSMHFVVHRAIRQQWIGKVNERIPIKNVRRLFSFRFQSIRNFLFSKYLIRSIRYSIIIQWLQIWIKL